MLCVEKLSLASRSETSVFAFPGRNCESYTRKRLVSPNVLQLGLPLMKVINGNNLFKIDFEILQSYCFAAVWNIEDVRNVEIFLQKQD